MENSETKRPLAAVKHYLNAFMILYCDLIDLDDFTIDVIMIEHKLFTFTCYTYRHDALKLTGDLSLYYC